MAGVTIAATRRGRRTRTTTSCRWEEVFAGSDACVAPVLEPDEVPDNPHMKARDSFVDVAGLTSPRPAPRFSATSPADPAPARANGQDTREILSDLGYLPSVWTRSSDRA